jgi:hypothetical protein
MSSPTDTKPKISASASTVTVSIEAQKASNAKAESSTKERETEDSAMRRRRSSKAMAKHKTQRRSGRDATKSEENAKAVTDTEEKRSIDGGESEAKKRRRARAPGLRKTKEANSGVFSVRWSLYGQWREYVHKHSKSGSRFRLKRSQLLWCLPAKDPSATLWYDASHSSLDSPSLVARRSRLFPGPPLIHLLSPGDEESRYHSNPARTTPQLDSL